MLILCVSLQKFTDAKLIIQQTTPKSKTGDLKSHVRKYRTVKVTVFCV